MSSILRAGTSMIGESPKATVWNTTVIVSTILMLAGGTTNTIAFKYQGDLNYRHGFIQTAFMFMGEYINLFFYNARISCNQKKHFKQLKEDAEEKGLKFGGSMFWAGLASLCDCVTSSLQIPSILLMPASINQMLCGGSIMTVVFISK